MSYTDKLKKIDTLQEKINSHGEFTSEMKKKINYRFRLDWNYYSNSMEGNTLTKDDTRNLMVDKITVGGKPIKDVMEMQGHDNIISEIIKIGKGNARLSEKRIKEIHKGIMHEVDEVKKKKIGIWKTEPNHIINYKGERFDFTAPTDVADEMHKLLNDTNAAIDAIVSKKKNAPHPVDLALQFHLKYITIHPFYDGNGRTGRILSNLLLISLGYPPFVIKTEERDSYYHYIGDVQCYNGDQHLLFDFIADLVIRSQKLVLNAIEGKDISGPEDFDKEIEMLKRMQKPKKEIIKKSNKVMQKILKDVYFPLLSESDKNLSKLNKLFKEQSWTYFEEPKPPKHNIPLTPTYGSLSNTINIYNTVPTNHGDSYHDFKSAYWLIKYNDQNDFSLEVSFKIHFSDINYKIEVFVGQPFAGATMVKMFTNLINVITKEKTPFDEYKNYHFPVKEYADIVMKETIKDWAAQISKDALDFIKKKVNGKEK